MTSSLKPTKILNWLIEFIIRKMKKSQQKVKKAEYSSSKVITIDLNDRSNAHDTEEE